MILRNYKDLYFGLKARVVILPRNLKLKKSTRSKEWYENFSGILGEIFCLKVCNKVFRTVKFFINFLVAIIVNTLITYLIKEYLYLTSTHCRYLDKAKKCILRCVTSA